ncbi:MAG TPA: PRC-barrel domain-containing protein, partial [Steroidobacteraceae bacterium]|nr:PRC-barrel domain-containing protein [Steroidobacteraceae bacterium]
QNTRGEADYRLASRIIGSQLAFDEGKVHEVEDFLIDLQTGQVTHFIIGTEEGFFSSDLRAVPADQISVKAGSLGTDLAFATVEEMEPYDTDVFW